ncbi:MAG: hypothetical protein LBQ59_03235 [Candidatus Peribacteria bacterium]|nr:hypothetical protein [Candidatus Peribacteria bacterium]
MVEYTACLISHINNIFKSELIKSLKISKSYQAKSCISSIKICLKIFDNLPITSHLLFISVLYENLAILSE